MKCIFDVLDLYAAMGKPGGGRNEVDPRFISMFSVYCMIFPSDDTIDHIFNSILMGHTQNFNDDIKSVVPTILNMTLRLYKVNFIKIIKKIKYTFNYLCLDCFSRTSTHS